MLKPTAYLSIVLLAFTFIQPVNAQTPLKNIVAKNITANGNITVNGTGNDISVPTVKARSVETTDISFTNQKYCSAVTRGSSRNDIIVPSSWTAAQCNTWAVSGTYYKDYQLACMTKTGMIYSAQYSSTIAPSPNCGW